MTQTIRIFTNCRAYTLSNDAPLAEAIAVRGDRIAAVGSGQELVARFEAGAEMVDLGGRTVVPGFIDAHNHLVDYGILKTRSANLLGSRSIEEIISKLKQNTRPGRWILGHAFDHELLMEGRWPNRSDLDRVSLDVPVVIFRVDGHACVANSKALEAIEGLSARQCETGILTEGAAAAAWQLVPTPEHDDLLEAARSAGEEALSKGVTSVHCVLGQAEEFTALQDLHELRALPVRIYAIIPHLLYPEFLAKGLKTGSGDEWLRIGAAKLFMDGSMGSHTAAMKEPFSDDPTNLGELLMDARELAEIIRKLEKDGVQAAVHAIGDRAVEEAANGIQMGSVDPKTRRHRIEHASQMTSEALEKMAKLRIPVCIQPQFVTSDFWTIDRVGSGRMRWSYPFRTMLDAGIPLSMGSDCPVERIDPMQLIKSAVTRDDYTERERLTVDQALRAYCLGGAYAAFEEQDKGSLEPGKLADFAVLSDDIYEASHADLKDIRVEMTVVGGHVAHDASARRG